MNTVLIQMKMKLLLNFPVMIGQKKIKGTSSITVYFCEMSEGYTYNVLHSSVCRARTPGGSESLQY